MACRPGFSKIRNTMRRLFPLFMVLSLAACASYAPHPLDADGTVLRSPLDAVLVQDAAAIDRPFLAPTTINLAAPLDANAVAVLAVISNPDLKAQRARAGVAGAQAFAARMLPDPTFSLGVDKVLSGPDTLLNLVAALGFDLNALRTREVRIAQAVAQEEQVRLDLAWAEWQTAGRARIQVARILGLERSIRLASASRATARSWLERTLRAAGRGDLSADQVQSARLTALDAEDRYRATERDLAAARLELTRLLGLPPAVPIVLAAQPLPDAPPPADTLFDEARTSRADLRALQAGYAAEEAAVHQAVLEQFPDLALTINVNRDSAGNTLLGPAVDFTPPLWNRNRGPIAIERATRAALEAEFNARIFQTRAEIAAAVDGIGIARRQRETLLHDLPDLARLAEASRRAADRGDLAPATADATVQALRDKETLLAQSEQDIAEQTIALELLTGKLADTWIR
jgi:outer membrane protein, heavy metal efflux system